MSETILTIWITGTFLSFFACIFGSVEYGFPGGPKFIAYTVFWPLSMCVLGARGMRQIWED